ncbi:hypothetical protein AB3R30_25190 [Leptolyngbyaceae cyanobacterium UHCC 1019]
MSDFSIESEIQLLLEKAISQLGFKLAELPYREIRYGKLTVIFPCRHQEQAEELFKFRWQVADEIAALGCSEMFVFEVVRKVYPAIAVQDYCQFGDKID